MEPLRVRSADTAPGIGTAEYFGQVPRSLITDADLSDGAARCYAAIRLRMAEEENHAVYLGTMGELGRLMGVTEREARRRVAELEQRGHVARERIRSIAGSPQAIRPLATLRGRAKRDARTRTIWSDCNQTIRSGTPDQPGPTPGPNGPVNRTDPSGPLQREGEETLEQQQEGGCAAGVVALSASPPEEEQPPTRASFLGALAFDLADALRPPAEADPPPRRAKRPRGPSAKNPPGAESRNSVPDAKDCTGEPGTKSTPEHGTEHKCR